MLALRSHTKANTSTGWCAVFMPSLNSFGSGVEKNKTNWTTSLMLLTLNTDQGHQAWHRQVKLNGCCHCVKFKKAYPDSSLQTKKICCFFVCFFLGGGGAQMAVWPANTDHYIPSHNFSRRVKNINSFTNIEAQNTTQSTHQTIWVTAKKEDKKKKSLKMFVSFLTAKSAKSGL